MRLEVDVDAIPDGEMVLIGGIIMEHIEQAGVHSGDSACSLPAYTLSQKFRRDASAGRNWPFELQVRWSDERPVRRERQRSLPD